MRFGLLVNRDLGDLEKSLYWVSQRGFKAAEVSAGKGGPADAEKVNPADLRSLSKKFDLTLVLDYYANPLESDPERAAEAVRGLKRAIEMASDAEVSVVVGSCGKGPGSFDDNLKRYAQVYPDLGDFAAAHGVKLAYEIWPGFNFAYTPVHWKKLFEAVPSKALGLNFDPSHLVWQFVDYLEASRSFSDRIYSVHAKDTEIISGRLAQAGITGEGWWRFRIPGWGIINWRALLSVLMESKYEGVVNVEHEDPLFGFEEGAERALKYLQGL